MIFIAPSLPFQGDQAVDAHTARVPAPSYSGGRVWSQAIVPCVLRGDDLAFLGLWGGVVKLAALSHSPYLKSWRLLFLILPLLLLHRQKGVCLCARRPLPIPSPP